MSDKIRVIIFKEENNWIAQGLEHDICVQAEKLEDIFGRFEVAVRLEDEEEGGLSRIKKAPKHFFNLWNKKSSDIKPSDSTKDFYEYGLAA